MLLGLISINILSACLLIALLFDLNVPIMSNNRLFNKFVLIPLYLAPLCLVMYLIYSMNREKYRSKFEMYQDLPMEKGKRNDICFWMYVIVSILIFIGAITSPVWIPRT
jgi:hypothetical protein